MKTIRINRAKWLRGSVDSSNYLWCSERQAGCCLGHAIHQTAKCAWEDLAGKSLPSSYYDKSSFLTEAVLDGGFASNELANEAMSINDANISEASREERLTELFRSYNIKLEFYN